MRIDCHVGLTFHIGPVSSNQYGRIDLTFKDIDPELDLEAQLGQGKNVASKAFVTVVEQVNVQAATVYKGGQQSESRARDNSGGGYRR